MSVSSKEMWPCFTTHAKRGALANSPVAQKLSRKMLLCSGYNACCPTGYPMVCEFANCKLKRRGDCLQNPNTQATSGEIHHNGDRSFPTNSMAHLVVLCNHNEHLYRRLFFRLHKTFVLWLQFGPTVLFDLQLHCTLRSTDFQVTPTELPSKHTIHTSLRS